MISHAFRRVAWPFRAALALTALLLASCQSVTEIGVPSLYSEQKLELQAGYTPAEKAAIAKNCFAGPPVVVKSTGRLMLVAREGYVLTHSSFLRGPLWVAEGIPAKQLSGPADRNDHFQPDPRVPPADRAELRDYAGAGYDRGHQAPAADFKSSQQLTDESFFLSNMSPQVGAGFNRAIWKDLEDFVREKIKANGSGYVITGPLLYDPAEDNPATSDGIVPVKWIGGGRIPVPTHFYKIMILPRPDGHATCVAFVLENKKYPTGSRYDFSTFIKSVSWIERRSGLNFMPDLDPKQERELEATPGKL